MNTGVNIVGFVRHCRWFQGHFPRWWKGGIPMQTFLGHCFYLLRILGLNILCNHFLQYRKLGEVYHDLKQKETDIFS